MEQSDLYNDVNKNIYVDFYENSDGYVLYIRIPSQEKLKYFIDLLYRMKENGIRINLHQDNSFSFNNIKSFELVYITQEKMIQTLYVDKKTIISHGFGMLRDGWNVLR